MSLFEEIVITPLELRNKRVISKKIILPKKVEVLLKGKIVNSNNKGIAGAIIVVTKIDSEYGVTEVCDFGYAITNEFGEYAIVLEKGNFIDYTFNIYEPMINQEIPSCVNKSSN